MQFTDEARAYIAELCRNTNYLMNQGWRSDISSMWVAKAVHRLILARFEDKVDDKIQLLFDLAEYQFDELLMESLELVDCFCSAQEVFCLLRSLNVTTG